MTGEAPPLSETEARHLTAHIVACLRARGVCPSRVGVTLDHEGFWFVAEINGRTGSARTGQGQFTYEAVAHELDLAARDPGWNRLTLQKGSLDVTHK